jgi:hypothetical protein
MLSLEQSPIWSNTLTYFPDIKTMKTALPGKKDSFSYIVVFLKHFILFFLV